MRGLETNKLVIGMEYDCCMRAFDMVSDALAKTKYLKLDQNKRSSRRISYSDPVTDTLVTIQFVSLSQLDSATRGYRYTEILISDQITLDSVVQGVVHCRLDGDNEIPRLERSSLFRAIGGKTYKFWNRVTQLEMLGGWKDVSWVEAYDFPPSLHRHTMSDLFEDPLNPTEEEFLMAIMMEGISGRTKEEIDAIKKAKVRIESKSNNTYPCKN